jgi:hypothetical protein
MRSVFDADDSLHLLSPAGNGVMSYDSFIENRAKPIFNKRIYNQDMPTLADALRGRDLGFLKMVAGAWGLDISAPDAATYFPLLTSGIVSHQWQADVLETLPGEAQQALQTLAQNDGRMTWALFTRRFGEVRPFGPGKREKERPDLKPVSPAETLWYRALIGRAFLKETGDRELLEYAFIPDDLLGVLRSLAENDEVAPGRPASPAECARVVPASDRILDHACSLLAWQRMELPLENLPAAGWHIPPALLLELLKAARLVEESGQLLAEPARAFLEAPRGAALALLAKEWVRALYLNELRLLPGLKFEGEWENHPLRARQAILRWVEQVPLGQWWSLASFIRHIREHDPDFQRPAGDYDSWFIRQESSGNFLRGFERWDDVDGALLRFMICGPLHWLGFLDLAYPAGAGGEPAAFCFSAWAEDLFHAGVPGGLPAEDGRLKSTSTGRLTLPRLFPRAARYQIARFCLWEDADAGADAYHYRITPPALERAARQNLRPRQLTGLLRKYAENGAVSPLLIQALERWESAGTQAVVERAVLLRLAAPEILPALKKSRAARFIQEEITPTLLLLRPGSEDKVLEALSELGYLGDVRAES